MSETSPSEQPEEEPKVEVAEYLDKHKPQVKDLISNIYENEMGWHSEGGRPDLDTIPQM